MKPKEKKSDNQLAKISPSQPPATPDKWLAALKFVADLTGEAKRAAADNPIITSSGKQKSSLKGATVITNMLKEEGIEAHKRGIVPQPNMEGGLQNNDMYVAATSALESMKLSEQQPKRLLDGDEKDK